MITSKIRTRHWLLLFLLASGLILSLVGIAVWRGEQQVNPEYFQSIYLLSIVGSIVFAVLLIVGVLYLRRLANR